MGDLPLLKNQTEVDCVYTILVVSLLNYSEQIPYYFDIIMTEFIKLFFLSELLSMASTPRWSLLSTDETNHQQQKCKTVSVLMNKVHCLSI